MPDGWTKRKLGAVIDIKHGFAFDSAYFNTEGVGVKLLTPAHFAEEGGFKDIRQKQKYYSGPVPNGYALRGGELLVAMTEQAPGLLGSPVLVPQKTTYLHNQRLGLVRVTRPEVVRAEFLFHVFNMPQVRRDISATAGGTKVRHSSPGKIKAVSWTFPPVREQERIATIASEWSSAIDCASRLVNEKRVLKKGLAHQLLTGRRRFPDFVTQPWREGRLGKFLSESRIRGSDGATARKLTVKLYGRGVAPKMEKLAGSAATQYFIRKSGQFIYSKLDFLNGAFGVVPDALDGYETTTDLPAFDVEEDLNPRWLLAYACREGFYRSKLGLAAGGRKARRVNPPALLRIKVPVPPRAEQDKIVEFLNALDREIELLTRQVDALKLQKKGLMQKLLTGQIRVKT